MSKQSESEFCPYCLMNLEFVNEGKFLHQMKCAKNYDAIPLNEYEAGRLLELLQYFEENQLPIMIGGDWQRQIIAKLKRIID